MLTETASKRVGVKVIGIGGGGCNAINGMVQHCAREGVEYIAVNTDQQVLSRSQARSAISIGREVTKGLGTGGDPEKGRLSAIEEEDRIAQALKSGPGGEEHGLDLVFIASAMGGGTGSGASPVVARIARELGALTIGVVTRPFGFEGPKRRRIAEQGIREMMENVDAMIVTDNNRLLDEASDRTSVTEAFRLADEVLRQGVHGVLDIITIPGEINMDFADVRAIMKTSGFATFGIGQGTGSNRATTAAKMAIANSLQEVPPYGARGLLVNIMASQEELGLSEVSEVLEYMRQHAQTDAAIKHGVVYNQSLREHIRVYVVATGLSAESQGLTAAVPGRATAAPVANTYEAAPERARMAIPNPVADSPVMEAPAPAPVVETPVEREPVKNRETASDPFRTAPKPSRDDLDLPAFLRRGSRSRHTRPLNEQEAGQAQDDDDLGGVGESLSY